MTIPPVEYNDFVIYQGADFVQTFKALAGSPPVAVDPTGWVISFTIKQDINASVFILNARTDNGLITIDSVNKQWTVKIPGTSGSINTANLASAENLVYNMTTIDTNGNIVRRAEGNISISPKV